MRSSEVAGLKLRPRLFDGMAADVGLEIARVIDSPTVTHLRYRVVK